MPTQRIPNPYKQNMQTMYKFTKNNLEDIYFIASDLRLSWFFENGIFDTISFYPNQKKIVSPNIKENN